MFKLPLDVVSVNVMEMVGLIDVVNLDSAVCSRKCRHDLFAIFAMTQPFDLRDHINPSCYSGSRAVWKWFWKRNISIKGVEARGVGIDDIIQNRAFVAFPLNLVCGNYWSNSGRSFAGSFSALSAVLDKIGSITLVGAVELDDLVAVIPRMTRLTSFVEECSYLTEEDAVQLIGAAPQLVEIRLKVNVSDILLNAILPMGPTLRSLSISTSTLQEEHYRLIAQHCPHLTTFHLEVYTCYNPAQANLPHAGVLAIAEGCRHLQDVYVSDFTTEDDFLLLFATHCLELRKIQFAKLTDAALHMLTQSCLQVVEIRANWKVECVETVHSAAQWLAQLRKIHWQEMSLTCRAALMYLRDVESLELQCMLVGEAELAVMATRCTRLRELIARVDDSPAMAACLASLVRNNFRLETIKLAGYTWVTDAAVEAIAESCPRLRVLECTEALQPSTLTDLAVVKLAQGCPKLRSLSGCSGPGITDVSVLALAEHCRHLETVDFRFTTSVTEGALRKLVGRTVVKLKDLGTKQLRLTIERAVIL